MISNPYQQYQEAQLETASPGKLLLMLYDGALRFLTQAHQAMGESRFQEAQGFVLRAEDIITELMATLDMSYGEIPQNLYNLYEYFNWRLVQAMAKRDPAMIEEVQERLRELRSAWVEAIKNTAGTTTGAA